MRHSHDLSPFGQDLIKHFHLKMTRIINRKNLQNGSLAPAHHLPWNYVGMMLGFSHDYLIPFLHEGLTITECNQIHSGGRTACKYDFLPACGIEKILHRIPCSFISLCSFIGKAMHCPMDIRVGLTADTVPLVKYSLYPLAGRSIVQVHEILAIHFPGKRWEQ